MTAGAFSLEADRMRGLANAAVEGLLVCDGQTIVAANNSFASLAGLTTDKMVGAKLETCIPDEAVRARLLEWPTLPIEAELRGADGSAIPVELILRPVDFAGKQHHAIAVRDLRARKQAEQHIRFLAHHDALTGLTNRNSFNKKLDHEIETLLGTGRQLAVLCLDLDRFKDVNDLFGHATGDTLLQTVARVVTGVLNQDQMMARLGGDEFAIIMPGLFDPTVAGRLAENILEAIRAESAETTTGAIISASIGIAICPSDATDRQTLIKSCRHGPLPRKDGGPRYLPILRSLNGAGGSGSPPTGTRSSPRHCAPRVRTSPTNRRKTSRQAKSLGLRP